MLILGSAVGEVTKAPSWASVIFSPVALFFGIPKLLISLTLLTVSAIMRYFLIGRCRRQLSDFRKSERHKAEVNGIVTTITMVLDSMRQTD
ncbi:hypothetical protein CPT_Moabite_006 [Serratia phage Moabite]|uniref:Uncharacterized protein n=1 Tax=Serratia phage Moabite TaxID=2587814 RepID=A0A4Y5TNV7_9CAUD|nr:hypothetical protein HWC48_gp006 [Serratia phage Moabite]QDB71038.1 hypothetical protein CPT_Moabite_006 [Serratia phage Moabite]